MNGGFAADKSKIRGSHQAVLVMVGGMLSFKYGFTNP